MEQQKNFLKYFKEKTEQQNEQTIQQNQDVSGSFNNNKSRERSRSNKNIKIQYKLKDNSNSSLNKNDLPNTNLFSTESNEQSIQNIQQKTPNLLQQRLTIQDKNSRQNFKDNLNQNSFKNQEEIIQTKLLPFQYKIIEATSITTNQREKSSTEEKKNEQTLEQVKEDESREMSFFKNSKNYNLDKSESFENYEKITGDRFTLSGQNEKQNLEYSPEQLPKFSQNILKELQKPKKTKNDLLNEEIYQLITVSGEGKIILNESTLQKIEKIEKNVSVLSIIGPYRSGKSFLLNRFNGKQQGFNIGDSTNPCTEGIWIWGTNDLTKEKNTQTLLLDTEGLFAYNRNEKTDMILFIFTALISSVMIYNTFGVINEEAIEKMSFLIDLGKYFGTLEKKGKLNEEELSKYFPYFIWVLRDFTLDLKNVDGEKDITAKEYLEQTLMKRNENFKNPLIEQIHESYLQNNQESLLKQNSIKEKEPLRKKNIIRERIKQIFKNRNCFTMVRPIGDENQLRNIEKVSYEDLRKEFKNECENLVCYVSSILSAKKFRNNRMNGKSFVEFIRIVSDSINQEQIPQIKSVWERLELSKIKSVIEELSKNFEKEIEDIKFKSLNESILYKKLLKSKEKQESKIFQYDLDSECLQQIYHTLQEIFTNQINQTVEFFKNKKEENLKEKQKEIEKNIQNFTDENKNQTNFIFRLSEFFEQELRKFFQKEKYDEELKQLFLNIFREFIIKIDLNEKNQQKKFNELEIQLSKTEGRYEASKNLLEKQKEMMDNILEQTRLNQQQNEEKYELKIQELKESCSEKIQEVQFDKERKNFDQIEQSNFQENMKQKQENQKNIFELKEMLKDIKHLVNKQPQENKQDLELEKKFLFQKEQHLKELEQQRIQNNLEVENVKKLFEGEMRELKTKNEQYKNILEETKILFLKKEAEIKILQEKIESEGKFKNSQMEFSTILCNISDQVMHLLQKMEKKVQQFIIKLIQNLQCKEI